jgi:hypothetical protein
MKARKVLDDRVSSITGHCKGPQWARHFREIFSSHHELLDPLLPLPFHRLIAYAGACVSFLTYSTSAQSIKDLAVLRLRAFTFLLVEGARILAKQQNFNGVASKPQFNRVYHHVLSMHHADFANGTLFSHIHHISSLF